MTTTTTDLARRARAVCPAWRIVEEAGALVLYGNGPPATWPDRAAAEPWLKAQEHAKKKGAHR